MKWFYWFIVWMNKIVYETSFPPAASKPRVTRFYNNYPYMNVKWSQVKNTWWNVKFSSRFLSWKFQRHNCWKRVVMTWLLQLICWLQTVWYFLTPSRILLRILTRSGHCATTFHLVNAIIIILLFIIIIQFFKLFFWQKYHCLITILQ